MNPSSTYDYLTWLFQDAGRVELRHQHGKQWNTTWHESPESVLTTARQIYRTGNLFTSLNHTNTDKLIEPIANDDITRYCRLFFDFDPERAAGTASTESELADALERSKGLARHMAAHGWPVPAQGLSGNGYHLMYRTALKNTPEVREQLSVIYTGLHQRFSDDLVSFDRSVRNPGRIAPLYGSVKRKGEPTAERPHRKSYIKIPQYWKQVTAKQVDKLANSYAKQIKPKKVSSIPVSRSDGKPVSGTGGSYLSLDVIAWFTAHGLYVGPLRGLVHGVRCPWSDEHSVPSPADGGDTVIFESDGGWPGFHCKHGHCVDRDIRTVISLLGDAGQYCAQKFEREVRHEQAV